MTGTKTLLNSFNKNYFATMKIHKKLKVPGASIKGESIFL